MAGAAGQLLAGGRVAARLAGWTLEHRGESAVIHATVEEHDIYWLEHAGRLDLRLDMGKSRWCWRGVSANLSGDAVRIEVQGKPEVRRG